jgi:hypothetical protein
MTQGVRRREKRMKKFELRMKNQEVGCARLILHSQSLLSG